MNERVIPLRRYTALWMILGFILGIWAGLNSQEVFGIKVHGLTVYTVIFTAGVSLLLLLVCLLSHTIFVGKDYFAIVLIMLSITAGMIRVDAFDNIESRQLKELAGTTCTLTGVITKDPEASNSGKSVGFPVLVYYAETASGISLLNGKIMVYIKPNNVSFRRGDTVSFEAALQEPEGKIYDNSFSVREYLYRQNISFSVFSNKIQYSQTTIHPRNPLYYLEGMGLAFQKSVLHSIEQSFGENSPESALLKGILLGYREDFTETQYNQFADSGFIHITAVSGMHVMFLAGFLTLVFRRLRLPHWLLDLTLLPALILFASAAAFTPSICRAALMLALMRLAYWFQREPNSLHSLAAAALILLLINPYTLTSYSFLLSFSAVLGIITFASPLQKLLSIPPVQKPRTMLAVKFINTLTASAAVSTASSIGIGFFTAKFFGRVSWGSIIGNIPILFLASFAFIGGFLNWLIYLILPSAAAFLAQGPLRLVLWIMNQLAAFFSLPLFRFPIPRPALSILPFYIATAWLLSQCLSLLLHKTKK
ncbi:ComEC/Rec2 family competence protein [Ructibacterium gallinarum]|uniref:ComEC/Rec2 family competence protein n=1 Tax=Ructibacterium gallinarum TaxID=2779355 RepID=A0A9D5R7M5_9FIRM|nr:ComEC/Rec2 family competence protein [Ructibacterium gallinarum]MBE5039371.1 ComEC/Rec2 family competence protein [Ructibacterium gallinarum]